MTLIAVALAALAIVSLVVSRDLIAEAWRPGSRFEAVTAQVIVTGGMFSSSVLVPNRVLQIATISFFVALLIMAELSDSRSLRVNRLLPSIEQSASNGTPVMLVLSLWLWLFGVNLWFLADDASEDALFRLVSGVTILLFVIVQKYRPITALQFYSAAITTIAFIVIAVPITPGAFVPCSQFKCNELGAILQGPFDSGNLLGLAAAMCAALLLAVQSELRRTFFVLLFLMAVLYTTMSRTSILAIGAAVILFAVDRILAASMQRHLQAAARVAAVTVAAVPMVLSMGFVFLTDASAFSNRGRIWALGREAVSDHPFTGVGIDRWSLLSDLGYFGRGFDRFTHSEFLLMYFSGGIVGLVLITILLYKVTFTAIVANRSLARGAVYPLVFAFCGIIETIWNPLTIDAGTWFFFALISVVTGVRFGGRQQSPTGWHYVNGGGERTDRAETRTSCKVATRSQSRL